MCWSSNQYMTTKTELEGNGNCVSWRLEMITILYGQGISELVVRKDWWNPGETDHERGASWSARSRGTRRSCCYWATSSSATSLRALSQADTVQL